MSDRPDSVESAAAWLNATLHGSPQTVAFIGAGLGYALEALERQSPGARAIVLEPHAGTAEAMLARRDWSNWLASGRLTVLRGPEYSGAAAAARHLPDLHTAPVLIHPSLAEAHAADVAHARQTLTKAAFAAKANDSARRASAGRYLLHTLQNVPRIARESDVMALSGIAVDRPAIVVAAGPSLDRNVHEVAPMRDRALVIACDTAARPLMVRGVDPDVIVASDPTPANAAHLTGLPASRSWLVSEASVHHSAFAAFDRRTFFFRVSDHHPWPWLQSVGLSRGTVQTWGSVATSAFSLALAMGCNPIVFAGADFAFTDGRPYCRGTSFEAQWGTWMAAGTPVDEVWSLLIERWPPVVELDLAGQQVRTAGHLVAFRDWIVEQTRAHAPRTIVNATGAGLLHGPSIEQHSLMSLLYPCASIDREAIHRALRTAHSSARGDLAETFRRVDDVLANPGHAARLLWREFAGDRVPDAAIDLALRSPEHAAWAVARSVGHREGP